MGYRDDLINRLQQDGVWDQLTSEQQKRFVCLTDDQARQMMVMDDQRDMGDQEVSRLFGLMSLFELSGLFRGALVHHQGPETGGLSRAGELLAEFLIQLRDRGLSSDNVCAGLEKLNPLVMAALTTIYKRKKE